MSIVITALVALLAAAGAAALAVALFHLTSRWERRAAQVVGAAIRRPRAAGLQPMPHAVGSVSVAGRIPLQSRVGSDDIDLHAARRPRWATPLPESDSA
jgi:hypothetical protein